MKQNIPVARITEYCPGIPLITVDRVCEIEEVDGGINHIKRDGDKCIVTITSDTIQNGYTEGEIIRHIKAAYFRKVFGCSFEVRYNIEK